MSNENAFATVQYKRQQPQPILASTAPAAVDGWTTLNVGGTLFHTQTTTLCAVRPTVLAAAVDTAWVSFPRDSKGNPFLDRDPHVFRHILNFLRGYPIAPPPNELTWLAQDARELGLWGLVDQLGAGLDTADSAPDYRFVPATAPGITDNGQTLAARFVTALLEPACGLVPGRHNIVFLIKHVTHAAVGVVHCPDASQLSRVEPFTGQPFSAVYFDNGEVKVNPTGIAGNIDRGWLARAREASSNAMTAAVFRGAEAFNAYKFEAGDRVVVRVTVRDDSRHAEVLFKKRTEFGEERLGPIALDVPLATAPPLCLRIGVSCFDASHIKLETATVTPIGERDEDASDIDDDDAEDAAASTGGRRRSTGVER